MESLALLSGHLIGDYVLQNDWMAANKTSKTWPCLVHCVAYAVAIWFCTILYFPWWVAVVAGVIHFPIDRWRLARKWMTLNGQESFATGPLSPWSIIVVDNTIHIVTLFALGMAAK